MEKTKVEEIKEQPKLKKNKTTWRKTVKIADEPLEFIENKRGVMSNPAEN